MNKFEDYFYNVVKAKEVHKWHHYFDIYDAHFKQFIGKNPVILEIGVQKGGSLDMWRHYFDGQCTIYGVDIDPSCRYNDNIFIGNQEDPAFWAMIKTKIPKIDILIDDGGHTMQQQIVTFEHMYSHVKPNGVYLCEDTHTSYWGEFGGGIQRKGTFMEYSKNFIDLINAWHFRFNEKLVVDSPLLQQSVDYDVCGFRKITHGIHIYDSIVVLQKKYDPLEPTHSIRC